MRRRIWERRGRLALIDFLTIEIHLPSMLQYTIEKKEKNTPLKFTFFPCYNV